MLDTKIQIKTEHFDGPLALLLLLVQKEEMDIAALDLTKITGQYLSFLTQLEELDFDLAGDYLYFAATLILLKSKNCLEEKDLEEVEEALGESNLKILSETDLVKRLEELDRFQKLGQKLWNLPKKGHDIFLKPKVNRKAISDSILTPLELNKLTDAMIEILQRTRNKYAVVKKEKISIKKKLEDLQQILTVGEQTNFQNILEQSVSTSRLDLVVTFISLLELARLEKVKIFQNEHNSEIYVKVVSDLREIDLKDIDDLNEEDQSVSDSDDNINNIENSLQGTDESYDQSIIQ